MTTTTTTTSNPVPSIDSAALLQMPADEWAQKTNGILEAHETATQNVPGSFTEEHEAARSGEMPMGTDKPCLPAQDDVQRATTNAADGEGVLAAGRCGISLLLHLNQALTSHPCARHSPPPTAPLRTSAQKPKPAPSAPRLHRPPAPRFPSPPTPNADLDNLTTLAHTGGLASLPPVTPLGSRFAENLVTLPGLASPPVLPDAPPAIPPPPNSTTTDAQRAEPEVTAPSPYGVLPHDSSALPSHSQSRSAPAGPPAPAVDVDVDGKEGSPQRKPKLVQRLKEKMSVGHAHS
ncbi:hypothetical protein DFH09DRAFT_1500451 [Mycena vulgaris]|nr:hypothetical protein DFH09DRAFT_1500451 [Mycena vulgaris]